VVQFLCGMIIDLRCLYGRSSLSDNTFFWVQVRALSKAAHATSNA